MANHNGSTGEVRLEPDGSGGEFARSVVHAESEDQAAGYQDSEEVGRIKQRRRPASARRPAAIDQNIGPRDESRFLGTQVDRQLADLFHLAPPAQRDAGEDLRVGFRILLRGAFHLRPEGPGLMPLAVMASGASSRASV